MAPHPSPPSTPHLSSPLRKTPSPLPSAHTVYNHSTPSSGYSQAQDSPNAEMQHRTAQRPNGYRGQGRGRGQDRQHQSPRRRESAPWGRQASRSTGSSGSSETQYPLLRTPNSPSLPRTPPPKATSAGHHLGSPTPLGHTGDSPRASPANHPIARLSKQHWAMEQELKIKISGLPKGFWTAEVHEWLASRGNIVRIEMIPGSADCGAWVVFQPPPASFNSWFNKHKLRTTDATLIPRMEVYPSQLRTLQSPVDSSKYYHELNILYGNAVDFGVSLADTKMMKQHTVRSKKQIQLSLDLGRKRLTMTFPLTIDEVKHKYKLEMPLPQIQHIYRDDDALIIPFNTPPRAFRFAYGDEELAATFSPSERTWWDTNAWYRQTDVLDGGMELRVEKWPVMNLKDAPIIDIGRWTTYRVSFDPQALRGPKFHDLLGALSDYGVSVHTGSTYTIQDKSAAPMWEILQDELSTTHPHLIISSSEQEPKPQSTFDDLFTSQIYLSFPVRYQLEACLSNGFLKEHTITREFLERLTETPSALFILEKIMDRQMTCYNPMDIFQVRVKANSRLAKTIPSYCFLARSVNITPTMMYVATPAVETSNRIIRKYVADADRFIRVKFSDEKNEGPLSNQGKLTEATFDKVTRTLRQGIVVAGRYYEFLAFGNSQFREYGAYFYAPTASRSADDIRRELGTFDHIKTVAKFGARLGQCFSTTRAIQNVPIQIVQIPDIERNGFNFTDGVGKLSLFLAQMAAQELGIQNAFEDPPSLYQFRLGGCKGVLALDPNIQGGVVHIRPSQYKFTAPVRGLEVIRASAFATAYFNRQLIIVLSTLGVPDSAFIKRQQEWMRDLQQVTENEAMALEKLQRNVDVNQTSLEMAVMILDGFMRVKEPFLMSLLHLWRAYNIKTLKEKARIFIEKGAFVLGCVDETATLRGHFDEPQSRPNATRDEKLSTLPEIFLQVSDTKQRGHYKVIEGICILARNPSLHAGDIRIVRAVNVPALHHLKNVVVLPQTGDRDLSNMCSGGDLDGDDYLVMWDPEFIPECINEQPMDFTPPKPEEMARGITVKDLTDFFVTYMKNNSLGQIAHAHLAQADFRSEGVRDEVCLELARLHSQAVDYPKSGIPAVMDKELRPRRWPHFMEKKHLGPHQEYRSTKVLGQLYDQVELVDFKPQYQVNFDERILKAFDLPDGVLSAAGDIKAEYDAAILRQMAKHGIRTEFEVWSIFVLSHNQETRDYKFAEELGQNMEVIKNHFRDACRKAASEIATMLPLPGGELLRFLAAMYTVTAREMVKALKECGETKLVGGKQVPLRKMEPGSMPLMSFPWLFTRELGAIATGSMSQPTLVPQPIVRKAKRPARPLIDIDSATAIIETRLGVTHFGDLLELDFEDSKMNQQQGGGETEGKDEKQGDHETSDRTLTGSDEYCGSEDGEDGSEQKEVKLEMGGGSVLDKLANLL
ncbi:RdRP-domain-containing protein [Westerdykella ornata]|uniref:RNA-dependent RNA polymerase n=1 Tax=Westerdykella ornata TaxID=318751 RepID=A0A6A6JBM6_WESOR|nr:RdRP-domain-containing protein [Westerdykella ornata]KAF2273695.1 RdRP-domain-containing protein [Westerdykella ornata]